MAEEVFKMLVPNDQEGYSVWEGALCSACFRSCRPGNARCIPPINMEHPLSLGRVDEAYAKRKGFGYADVTFFDVHSGNPKNSEFKRMAVKCEFCGRAPDDTGGELPKDRDPVYQSLQAGQAAAAAVQAEARASHGGSL
jgi:hypothetical protein